MKKIISILIIFVFVILFANPIDTFALDIESFSNDSIVSYKLDGASDIVNGLNKDQDCSGVLGDPNDENSVAWLLQTILNFTRVIGPVIVVILSSIDFAKVIVTSDDDAMNKTKKKLAQRLILAVLLFFVPTLASVILSVFGITSNPTCGIG